MKQAQCAWVWKHRFPKTSRGPGPGLASAVVPERTLDWCWLLLWWMSQSTVTQPRVTEQAAEAGGGPGTWVEGPRNASWIGKLLFTLLKITSTITITTKIHFSCEYNIQKSV